MNAHDSLSQDEKALDIIEHRLASPMVTYQENAKYDIPVLLDMIARRDAALKALLNYPKMTRDMVSRGEVGRWIEDTIATALTPACNGICLTAGDLGGYGDDIVTAHPECPAHGLFAKFNVDGTPR